MPPRKEHLYVIAEEQYAKTTWYNRIMERIGSEAARRRLQVVALDAQRLPELAPGTIIVLLGSSFPFISSSISLCLRHELRPVVAGFEVSGANAEVSYVTINRRHAMSENIKSLVACGATRIALFGVNSAVQTDMLRYEGWRDTVQFYRVGNPQTDVFYSDHGLQETLAEFMKVFSSYDAVACANDYCAVCLLSALRQRGVRVPEELMVTGFGNIRLGRYTSPPLTTVALRLDEVGNQVVQLYRMLVKNPGLLSCSVTINFEIVVRQTTRPAYKSLSRKFTFSQGIQPAFEPTYEHSIRPVYLLENAVGSLDETDVKILRGILRRVPYSALSESLYLSDTALHYRMSKLFAATETPNRATLEKLLKNYIPCFLCEDSESGEDPQT